jgi:hypothetical protein
LVVGFPYGVRNGDEVELIYEAGKVFALTAVGTSFVQTLKIEMGLLKKGQF